VRRPEVVKPVAAPTPKPRAARQLLSRLPWRNLFLALVVAMLAYGGYNIFLLLWSVSLKEWLHIGISLLLTLTRVLTAIALSTLIAVPLGIWIGSDPKLSRYLMPITQIAASFPAPLVFPNLVVLIYLLHGNLEWGAVVLMMFGTIWYILFNVISGASAVPQDLRACTQLTHLSAWQRWRTLWLPGIFPALTTGWITAAGGAWNASIVSEYVQQPGQTLTAHGLGAVIQDAQTRNDYPVLAASVLAMAIFVVFFNRTVWKRLSALAQERYQLIT
jgi:NitT/TauT family transport system permease protein